MHWITSAGGPLVLIPETMMPRWHGATRDGGDYAMACAVDDYAGVIYWDGIDVLVLGDEPLATTCLVSNESVFLLRWMYAPNEDAITSVVQDIGHHFPVQQGGIRLSCQAASYVLFDAGAPGSNITERIDIDVAPGSYTVETHVWKPSDDVELIVHVMRKTVTTSARRGLVR